MSKIQALFYLGYWVGVILLTWVGLQVHIWMEKKRDSPS